MNARTIYPLNLRYSWHTGIWGNLNISNILFQDIAAYRSKGKVGGGAAKAPSKPDKANDEDDDDDEDEDEDDDDEEEEDDE